MHLKALTATALLFALASTTIAQTPQTFEVSGRVDSLVNMVKDLSKITGETWYVKNSAQKDVLYLSVKDATAAQIRQRIAEAVDGTWTFDGSAWELSRSIAKEKEQEAAVLARVAEGYEKQLKPTLDDIKSNPIFDKARVEQLKAKMNPAGNGPNPDFASAMTQMPAARATAQLVQSLGVRTFADLPLGSRTVFSTRPTRMQRALPNNALKLLQQLSDEEAELGSGMRMFGSGNMRLNIITDGAPTEEAVQGPITNGMVVVKKNGDSHGCSITFVGTNARGQQVVSATHFLDEPAEAAPNPLSTDSNKEIEFSDLSAEFLKVFDGMRSSSAGGMFRVGGNASFRVVIGSAMDASSPFQAPSSALRDILLKPDQYEPLSLHVRDVFKSISSALEVNAAVLLPDSTFPKLANLKLAQKPTVKSVLERLQSDGTMQLKKADGWLTGSPVNQPSARRERVNRGAFARLLKSLGDDGLVSLDERADYASQATNNSTSNFMIPFMSSMEAAIVFALEPDANARPIGDLFTDRETLRFLGSLTMQQRGGLRQEGRIPIGSLSSAQRGHLEQLVFWSEDGPQSEAPQQPDMRSLSMAFGPFGRVDPSTERTNVLATGLPATGFVTARFSTNRGVIAKSDKGVEKFLSDTDLAFRQVQPDIIPAGIPGEVPETFSGYKLVTELSMTLRVMLQPQYAMSRELADLQVPRNAQFGRYQDLPREFLREIEQSAQRMKEAQNRINVSGVPGARQAQP